jgi:tight adherence protein B
MIDFVFLVLVFSSAFLFAHVIFQLLLGVQSAIQNRKLAKQANQGNHTNHATNGNPAATASNGNGILRDDRYSHMPFIDQVLRRLPLIPNLYSLTKQAGVSLKPDVFILMSLLLAALSLFGSQFLGMSILLTVASCLCVSLLPYLSLYYKKIRRRQMIDQQLPAALDMIARAMQAGHSFINALALSGSESPAPIGPELTLAAEEINFGISTKDSLSAMANRIDTIDIRYFVLAVLIHGQMGGKLTDLLLSLAQLIRERQRLRKTVRVLSAEGRMSAWILGLLPFGVGSVIYFVNPEFVSLLWTTPIGVQMLQFAGAAMVFGVLWMIKIIRIRI